MRQFKRIAGGKLQFTAEQLRCEIPRGIRITDENCRRGPDPRPTLEELCARARGMLFPSLREDANA
jgi:hypothetical protein